MPGLFGKLIEVIRGLGYASLAELEARKPVDSSGMPGKDQINFTDSDSRIMDTKNQGVIQAYNPQIAVNVDHGFIVGMTMSNRSSDQKQLDAVLTSVENNRGRNGTQRTNTERTQLRTALLSRAIYTVYL